MMCTHPYTLKDGSKVPCGHCMPCRIMYTQEWAARLYHEASEYKDNVFITLTYNDESLPSDYGLQKRDVQLFVKRLRKDIEPIKIKYYLCGEYGEKNGRPHYHAIIFNFGLDIKDKIQENWDMGFVKVGTVTYQSISYVTSYITKKLGGDKAKEVYGDRQAPFIICSKGLGLAWAEKNHIQLRINQSITIKGKQVGIPRYYVKKLEMDLEKRQNEQNEKTYKQGQLKAEKYKYEPLLAFERKRAHAKMKDDEYESKAKMYKKGNL